MVIQIMTQLSALKILVLGSKQVGKSAVVVRFLTKRFIGEYGSNSDWVYKQCISLEDGKANVEILDISRWTDEGTPPSEQMRWADAFVVIYSICDRKSFHRAINMVDSIRKLHAPAFVPVLLLANKVDLEHSRQISIDEGLEAASLRNCMFHEVSAADNYRAVYNAFQAFLRETRQHTLQRSLPRSRKLSIIAMSKVFSAMFGGKNHHNQQQQHNNNNNAAPNPNTNPSSNKLQLQQQCREEAAKSGAISVNHAACSSPAKHPSLSL